MRLPSAPGALAFAIIATFTVMRLVLAATVGLGLDGDYTVGVAHDLDLSYYDHPPLQYWLVHLFLPLLGDGRAMRLPFIALFAGSCWLLYCLTRRLFSAQAGVIAVLALNCAACFTFGVGALVMPDGPLIFAQLAAALALARGLFPGHDPPQTALRTWLHTGFWIGVAALSKYHALLFAAGVLLFLLTVPGRRRQLAQPWPWLGALLALAVASPVIAWNIQHDWISVGFQVGRAAGTGLHPGYVLANIAAQALWLLPWIFVAMLVAAWQAWRAGPANERYWYCLCLAAPTIAVFTLVPLWGSIGLPHWQMPGWLMLFPVFADWAVRCISAPRLRRWSVASTAAVMVFAVLIIAHARTGFGRVLAPRLFASGDPTLQVFDWSQLPPALESRGLLQTGTFLITSNWIYAGKIDHALHDAVPIVIFGDNPKQFGVRYDPQTFLGRDAIVLEPVDSQQRIANDLRPYFESLEELAPLYLGRSGLREIHVRVFRAHRLRNPLPAPYWRQ
ncbi:MAG TPA: glycosyltransferase family 39 protein [Steroidobacteraceae bacterium]|nr:glycosyltransferase family 39 protein [Steroidobacteraceae bacterium]